MEWKIFYEDGSTFSNLDGFPEEAPAFGVVGIACQPDLWGCGDFVGLIDYLAHSPGYYKVVRFGRLVANDVYDRVIKACRDDPDFNQNTRHVYEQGDYYWWKGPR